MSLPSRALLALALLAPAARAQSSAARIQRAVAWLAADRLEGRATGTPGSDSAAAYVARRFAALRLTPIVTDDAGTAACAGLRVSQGREAAPCATFLQHFTARSAALAHAGRPSE